jgi:[ribosomal protein S5]-alanine N-acetyltransferase
MKLKIAQIDDAEELFEMKQDKLFQKYFPKRILARDLEEQRREIFRAEKDMQKCRGVSFVIEDAGLIGFIEMYKINKTDRSCAIGFGIKKSEWNKGNATKAVKQLVKIIQKMEFHTIEATVFPGNKASERVLEKAGFDKIGTMKDYYFANGKYLDRILYWKVLE